MSAEKRKLSLFAIGVVFVLFIIGSCNSEVATLPGITSFLTIHTEFGKAKSVEKMPDWANGKRQQVKTSKGSYLFYLINGDVVTVYIYDAPGRKVVWRR